MASQNLSRWAHPLAAGQGTPRDYAEARQWLERAALQGLPEAQVAVAQIFRDGLGVTRNGPEALSWHKKAAVAGYAEAQYALGEMYADIGVTQRTTPCIWRTVEVGNDS
jgi:TPR repeat protein